MLDLKIFLFFISNHNLKDYFFLSVLFDHILPNTRLYCCYDSLGSDDVRQWLAEDVDAADALPVDDTVHNGYYCCAMQSEGLANCVHCVVNAMNCVASPLNDDDDGAHVPAMLPSGSVEYESQIGPLRPPPIRIFSFFFF